MESKPDRRLITVAVLAFIGVILLVATVVLTYTAAVALITGSDGPPQELVIERVQVEYLENASVIHLTDQDLKQYPVIESAIRDAAVQISGKSPMTGVENLELIESFGIYPPGFIQQ